uniref:Putative transcriptional coactivator caper rrm superfamily protein n=1 Tax=Hyalomma excavatum TaxID=257692 RepID=A0A131XAW1_9ACAR
MASIEEQQELAVGNSGASDGEGSVPGSLAGPQSPEVPASALEEGEAVAERKSEEAAVQEAEPVPVAPIQSPGGCNEGVVESEEEGAVHSPEPAPQQHLTEDISEDAVEATPAVPVAKKCLNSRSMEPLEGELDFEDDAPPESPSGTSLDKAPNKDGKEVKVRADNLEEGEAEDDGEVSDVSGTELSVQDDDLEEGELPEGAGGGTGTTRKAAQVPRPICRFFNKGQCTWGSSCRFIHPGINDRGNYNMFATVPKPPHHHMPPPIGGPAAVMRGGAPPPEFLGPPMPPLPPPPEEMMLPPVESAWERGLRHAKELMKRASRRKEQEPDFEEKRLNIVPPHHDRTPLQSEVDKENDFYGASGVPPTSRGMSPPYARPPMPPPPPHHLPRGARRGDSRRDDFYGFDEPDPLEHSEREARDYWHGGRYENFEVRWSNRQEYDHRDRREKERRPGRSYDREKSSYSHGSRSDRPHGGGSEREPRWREDRFHEVPPPPPNRSRPDEWRDPWRRSKTPKGRRSRSRGRNRRSFSNCSSRSLSSRSSRTSDSCSRSSSSRSSYTSYDSRSRSRSPAPASTPAGRPRGNQPPSRGPPMYGPPSQAPGKQGGGASGGTSGGTGGARSPVLDRRKQYNPSPPPNAAPLSPSRKSRRKAPSPPPSKQKKSRSGSFSASSSRSRSRSSSSRTPSRSRSRSYTRSPSLNSVSSASSSPSCRRIQGSSSGGAGMLPSRNPSPPKKVSEGSKKRLDKDLMAKSTPPVKRDIPLPPPASTGFGQSGMMLAYREPLPPPLDLGGFDDDSAQRQAREAATRQQGISQKPQIKLTLIKKTLPVAALCKKEEPAVKNNGDKGAKKRPASPKLVSSPSPPPTGRKSTTLRREELLKQLKAVEDAIARKRAKFS